MRPPLLLVMFQLLLMYAPRTRGAFGTQSPYCKTTCGNISIPYPFGIGDGCFASDLGGFAVICDETSSPPKPMIQSNPQLEILEIDLMGNLKVFGYVGYQKNVSSRTKFLSYDLLYLPYSFSVTNNTFTVVGCDTQASIHTNEGTVGCTTYCSRPTAVSRDCYFGSGCCTFQIPAGIKSLSVSIRSLPNYTKSGVINSTGFGFLAAKNSYRFRQSDQNITRLATMGFPIKLIWSIGDQTCKEARKSSSSGQPCPSDNSECGEHESVGGYVCRCKFDAKGNPYLERGCKDALSFGMIFNPTVVITIGLAIGLFLLLAGSTCYCLAYQRRKIVKQRNNVTELRRKMFEQNGGLVLLEQILIQPGNNFKIFSEAELVKATDNFKEDHIIGRGGHGVVYMGRLGGVVVAIKKSRILNERESKEFAREMAILSQINHVNIVKILGCCLEVEIPMLVYEFISGGTLFDLIHRRRNVEPFALASRIQVATEVAEALAYLHSYASPPIFHKDIKSSNILMDGNRRAKVSDFGASAVAPVDEEEVATVVQGTCGYLDPQYLLTYQFTEKSDVYSFGVLLVELLSGRKAFPASDHRGLAVTFVSLFRQNKLAEILDSELLLEGQTTKVVHIAQLACQCLCMKGIDRPTMKEVVIVLHASNGPPPIPVPIPYRPEEEVDLEHRYEVSYRGLSLCTSVFSR